MRKSILSGFWHYLMKCKKLLDWLVSGGSMNIWRGMVIGTSSWPGLGGQGFTEMRLFLPFRKPGAMPLTAMAT